MLGETKVPKTKQELVKSIQSIPRMDFTIVEAGSSRDRTQVISTLDRAIAKGPVSIILIQEK